MYRVATFVEALLGALLLTRHRFKAAAMTVAVFVLISAWAIVSRSTACGCLGSLAHVGRGGRLMIAGLVGLLATVVTALEYTAIRGISDANR